MPTLVSTTTIQEFSLDEIKKLICKDLDIKEEAVKIEPVQEAEPSYDLYDRGPTRYVTTGIRVTINNLV